MIKNVKFDTNSITAVFKDEGDVNDLYNPSVMLALLDKHVSEMDKMLMYPEAYDLVIVKEDYGSFFSMGSPQLFELGWDVNVKYNDEGITLTINNLS